MIQKPRTKEDITKTRGTHMFVLNVPIEDLFSSSDFIRLSKRSHGKHTRSTEHNASS